MPMPTHALLCSKQLLGGLYVNEEEQHSVFPLKHTDVYAKITGHLSRVEVTQTFDNPFSEPLEAVYIFPLPDEAAVDEMEIKLSDRIIEGNIKKREEAQTIYEQACSQGRTAGLLEQERDNIFTQSLAHIKPGEQIEVTIRYTDQLQFQGGNYEFVFPMVVGPRFIPGTPIDESGDTDFVPDASRITPPLIPPDMRSGHDIGVTVEIDAGVAITEVYSTSHQINIEQQGQILRVKLSQEDTIPNKDLILRYGIAKEQTQTTVLTHADQRGNHFAVYLIPALDYSTDEIVPKDVVFLIDTSGSQMGDPLLKSQELMRRFINGLNPKDTFTIIDISDTATQLSTKPLSNTPQNCRKAINYINQLKANGGTYLLKGIRNLLNLPAAPEGRLRSIVLLSDGYISNENQVLAEVQQQLKPGNRIYSFGVGSSPNRFLLNRLAEIGRGIARMVRQDEPTEAVAEQFFRQINNPVLTNIHVTWEGPGEAIIYPNPTPDLFTQQPLVICGRISLSPEFQAEQLQVSKLKVKGLENNQPDSNATADRVAWPTALELSTKQHSTLTPNQPWPKGYATRTIPTGTLRITGTRADGSYYEKRFNLNFDQADNPAIAQLWGRARIKHLMQQMLSCETKAGVEAVTATALSYQLLCQYTAFVAVSDQVTVAGESHLISMQVPVTIPEGVNWEGMIKSTFASAIQDRLRLQKWRSGLRAGDKGSRRQAGIDINSKPFPHDQGKKGTPKNSKINRSLLFSLSALSSPTAWSSPIPRSVLPISEYRKLGVKTKAWIQQSEYRQNRSKESKLSNDNDNPYAPGKASEIIPQEYITSKTLQDRNNDNDNPYSGDQESEIITEDYFGTQSPDNFELTLVCPRLIQKVKSEILSSAAISHHRLQLVRVKGLDEIGTTCLTQHLQRLNLPLGVAGEIVFEFLVRRGRVIRVMWDEAASTLTESQMIDLIKRSLSCWRVPQTCVKSVCLTLRINEGATQ
ncbi:MAG: after-VIT domain-containing protein [Moorea sp. SIO4A1]|nr:MULTISPECIES: VIT domain-containing protein [unclassified Moorena]NEO18203.1 after-VIT domain-containing protein [Moorena sp. SIO4A5]NEQ57326.1 after-VIT domain-containing protein [Moorena sp. SIO4A1]